VRCDGGVARVAAGWRADATCPTPQALKLTPEGHPERLNLHSNRAAAYLMLRQYADVVAECSFILKAVPTHAKALARRAKAYDATMQYAKALRDLDSLAESGGDAGEDLGALHERVRALAADPSAASKPLTALPTLPPRKGGAGAAAAREAAAREAAAREAALAQRPPPTQWVKCTLGDDTRLVAFPSKDGVAGLRNALARKWPEEAVPLVVKAVAPPPAAPESEGVDGEARNAEVDATVAAAAAAAVAAGAVDSDEALFGAMAPWAPTGRMPRLRLVRPGEDGEPPYDSGLLEEWILDFAGLVREHLGVDAEAHLELHSEGLEACNKAMSDNVSVAGAAPLLAQAAAKFQEAAAFALFNWGNVHMCSARKRMDAGKPPAGGEGAPPPPPVALPAAAVKEVEALLASAEARYVNALGVKGDFYDASIASAQQRYEHARLLAPVSGRESEADKLFAEADSRFKDVVEQLPDEPAPPPTPEPAALADGEVAPEAESSVKAQVLVMHGNVLYEWSAARVRAGKAAADWQPLLDRALEKFQAAGCAQADIDAAVATHAGKAGK
jgi:hypothetical protein